METDHHGRGSTDDRTTKEAREVSGHARGDHSSTKSERGEVPASNSVRSWLQRPSETLSLSVTLLAALGLATLGVSAITQEPTDATSDHIVEFQQNLKSVGHLDIPGAMSITFSSRKPQAYVSTRGNSDKALVVVDITDPKRPKEVAALSSVDAGLDEIMNLGLEDLDLAERPDGTAFVLLSNEKGLSIVDVSDVPRNPPRRMGGFKLDFSHTWTCVGKECNYVYATTAPGDRFKFSIFDVRNPSDPKLVATPYSLVAGLLITHDWNYDEAGLMWAVGNGGIAAYDATDPTKPKALNTSDQNGKYLYSEYNDRAQLHSSLRPNARRFKTDANASVHEGNVLLVHEEGDDQDCTDSFQTWYVPNLDARKLPNPPVPNSGTITPLDAWSLALDTIPGVHRPVHPDFCSVHWFDYHQGGFVAMAAYGSGTRLVDVRDACNIVEVGYNWTEYDAANQSYWVPERNRSGHVTGRASNLVYTADAGSSTVTGVGEVAVRGGIDVFEATLPSAPRSGCSGR